MFFAFDPIGVGLDEKYVTGLNLQILSYPCDAEPTGRWPRSFISILASIRLTDLYDVIGILDLGKQSGIWQWENAASVSSSLLTAVASKANEMHDGEELTPGNTFATTVYLCCQV